jgi:hypothetical protein
MCFKLLLFLTWIFYLAVRRTADEVWFFCMIVSGLMATCAVFYNLGNQNSGTAKVKRRG